MPTSPVVAMTLPFGEASATLSVRGRAKSTTARSAWSGRAVLPIADYQQPESSNRSATRLLEEAIRVSTELGVEVRRRWLAGTGGGSFWRSGVMRVVLDCENAVEQQLATLANALRGDRRLSHVEMSPELCEFLDFRRAA